MKEFLNSKLVPAIGKFVNLKAVQSLKNGVILAMPLTIVGSILLLLYNFPIDSVKQIILNIGLGDMLLQGYNATFAILSLVITIGIAYNYAKLEGQDPLSCGIVSLVLFILLMNNSVTTADGVVVTDVIPKEWTSSKGMISAIIVGLFVGKFYSFLLKKKLTIKMPDGVPEGVAKAFASLIPAAIIITLGLVVYSIFGKFDTNMLKWIYDVVQTPLQGMTDTLPAMLIIGFTVSFLWFFGIHGGTVVASVITPLLLANGEANDLMLQQGIELTRANGGHIVTPAFYDLFTNMAGSGITLGLTMYLVAFAKSKQSKELGKLALVPGLFNINEPILFGIPIVMNPFLAIPFILMPMISAALLYFSQVLGLVPLFGSILLPWTTPPIISGFIIGGWRAAALQAIVLIISFFVYLPFARKIDAMNLELEKENQ